MSAVAWSTSEVRELLEAVRMRQHLTNKQLAYRFGKTEASIKGAIRRAVRKGPS